MFIPLTYCCLDGFLPLVTFICLPFSLSSPSSFPWTVYSLFSSSVLLCKAVEILSPTLNHLPSSPLPQFAALPPLFPVPSSTLTFPYTSSLFSLDVTPFFTSLQSPLHPNASPTKLSLFLLASNVFCATKKENVCRDGTIKKQTLLNLFLLLPTAGRTLPRHYMNVINK